jgi:hypothetical protein
MVMHFLISKYLQKDAHMTSASQISERWRLTNEQHSCSAHSTVRAIRAMMPEDMADCTDDPIHQNILAASPYLIVHTVRSIHQPVCPLLPPVPNI